MTKIETMEVANKIILIVEDDAGLSELLDSCIRECGFQTTCALNAAEALNWLNGHIPTLILLDYSLPDMVAKEFIAELMNRLDTIPPFVVATGRGDERIAVEMMKLGAKDYIIKDSHFLEMIPIVVTRVCTEIEKEIKLIHTQQALTESNQFNNQFNKQIIDCEQEGVVVYDLNKRIIIWNPYMENISGEKASNVLNRYIYEVFPFVDSVGLSEKIDNALQGNVKSEIEYYYTSQITGKTHWIADNVSTLQNVNGQIIGAISNVSDITDRKKAEETLKIRETYLTAIIENLPGIIWLKDVDSHILLTNTKFAHTFGSEKPEDLLGKTDLDFSPKEHAVRYLADDKKVVGTKKSLYVEEPIYDQNSTKWFETYKMPILDENNQVIGTTGYSQDISERKRAELAIRESEEKFKKAFTTSPDAINITCMEDGMYVSVNTGFTRIMGYSEDEVLGKTSIEKDIWVNPTDRDLLIHGLHEKGVVENLVAKFRTKSGDLIFGMMSASVVELNGIKHILSITRDISELKNAEKALLDSQQRFSLAIQATQDGIWERDLVTNESVYSPRWCEILGYSFDDPELPHTYQSWAERIHPDDYDRVITALNSYIETGSVYKVEYRHLHKSGEYRWQKSTGTSVLDKDGKAIKIVGCISDITERKRSEIALSENEEKFRNIFENSIVGKSITTIDGKITVNDAFSDIVGYTIEELSGLNWREFTHKDDIEYNANEIKSLLEGEKHFSQWEKRYIHKNGNIVWVHISLVLLRDNEENPIHFVTEIYDITSRKQAEEELGKSEVRFRMLAENSIDVIWKMGLDGRFTYVSPSVFQLRGFTPEEVLQQNMQEAICPGSIEVVQQSFALALSNASLASESRSIFFPIEQPCKDGTTVWTEATANLIYDDAGCPIEVVGVTRDITERRKLELEREQFFKFFEIASDIMVIADPQGAFLKVNPSALKILGYSEAELVSKSFIEFVHKDDRQNTIYEMDRQMKNGSSINFVNRYICKDGRILWLSWIADYKKEEGVTYATARDITEQLQAEMELKSNRDVLSKLLFANTEFIDSENEAIDYKRFSDNMLEISGAKYAAFNIYGEDDDRDFTTVAVSGMDALQEKVKSILGFELVNKKWKQDLERESKLKDKISIRYDSLSELIGSVLPTKLSVMIEKVFNIGETWIVQITKKNKIIGDFTLLFTKRDAIKNRAIVELYASQVGLYLERLKSENALRKSEEVYRNLVMRIPDGVYKSTAAGKFLDVNPAMIKMLGYDSKEDMLKLNIISDLYFNASDRDIKAKKHAKDIISVFQLKRKDGTGVWIEDHGWYNTDAKGNILTHEGVLRDITERKKAEDAIMESERLLRESQAVARLGSYSWDIISGYWTSSQIMDGIFGIDTNYDRSTEGWLALIHPDWRKEMSDYISNEVIGKLQRFDKEYIIIRKDDGQECWVHGLGQLEFDEFNQPIKLIGTITIVDGRKLAEIALNEKMNELLNFQRLTVGRELSMIELKREINELHTKLGLEPKYRIVE